MSTPPPTPNNEAPTNPNEDLVDKILINNQLRHFGTKVQDNPMSDRALSIISEDNEFCMLLSMQGTIGYT
jgi:hypothetical protein